MIAGIDFPSLFDKDNFSTRRTTGHNLYDPESLLTGSEASRGFDYANSSRDWPDESFYRAAVSGVIPVSDIPGVAPRVLKTSQPPIHLPYAFGSDWLRVVRGIAPPAKEEYVGLGTLRRKPVVPVNVPVIREDEHIMATFEIGHDQWVIVNRTFAGVRVKHGPWVEWPIIRPIDGQFAWAVYQFNHESNGPEPIPSIITTATRELLRDRALSLKAEGYAYCGLTPALIRQAFVNSKQAGLTDATTEDDL